VRKVANEDVKKGRAVPTCFIIQRVCMHAATYPIHVDPLISSRNAPRPLRLAISFNRERLERIVTYN